MFVSATCRSRESKHLQQLEEQQRFAQQLQQIADAATAPDASANTAAAATAAPSAAAAADAAALAAVVEGLGPGADAAAKLAAAAAANPALLIANTWALDGIAEETETGITGVGGSREVALHGLSAGEGAASCVGASTDAESAVSAAEKAEAEAAAAVQQYYRQLHEAARQQAALNAQVKGTYGLKAYKGENQTADSSCTAP
jgi:hypothetical protein